MNIFRRLSALVIGLAVVLLFAAESCAEGKKVGLMWIGKFSVANKVAIGFLHRMAEIAPDVEVIQKIRLPNLDEAEKVFQEFESTSDAVVFLRSTGAKILSRTSPKKPCFIGACEDPKALGVVKNPAAPEGSVTGVTNHIPPEKRFDAIMSLFPKVKSLALLAERGDPSTPIEQAATRSQCERRGIAYHEVIVYTVDELKEGMESLVDKVDLFIVASTALTVDNMSLEAQIATPKGKPLFSYAEGRTRAGATAELAADDLKLGWMLAESVVKVIVEGTPISGIPVKSDPEPKLVVNERMVSELNLKIPEAALAEAILVK